MGKEDDRSNGITEKLREADRLLGEGQEIAVVAMQLKVSERTLQRWRAQYGGPKSDDAKRLTELECENAGSKRIVADRQLEHQARKEIAKGNVRARRADAMPFA